MITKDNVGSKQSIKADTVGFPGTGMHVKLHKQITAAHSRGRMAAGRHNEIQFYFDTSLTTRHTTWLTLCGGLTLT
jgi:hypothetical protein